MMFQKMFISLILLTLIGIILGANSKHPSQSKIVPIASCDDDSITVQKFYKEKCSNDSECHGAPIDMLCKNNLCQCVEGFEPTQRFVGERGTQTLCVPSPGLFSKCKENCQKPAKCLLFTGEGGDRKTKICQCPATHVLKDSTCFLKCEAGETYDAASDKCVIACKSKEVNVDGVCKPLADLGLRCESRKQCLPSFSTCLNGKCVCSGGFSQKAESCHPQKVTCPAGKALQSNSVYQRCKSLSEDDSALTAFGGLVKKSRDNCPSGYFCLFLAPHYGYNVQNLGYCCQDFEVKCPAGDPHSNASCRIQEGKPTCPTETHYCYGGARNNQDKEMCCPSPCPNDKVYLNGNCYPYVAMGGNCDFKQQCYQEFTDCCQGKCQCIAGAKLVPLNGICDLECADDEVRFKEKCEKRLNLGDQCHKDNEHRCPDFAFCNKDKLCACRCGTFTLADNTCAPAPICQPAVFSAYQLAGADHKAAPPHIPRITDAEREKLLKNITMCAVSGKKSPHGAKLGQCAAGQFCSHFIKNVGVCCPKPEPYCFGAEKPLPNKKCDIRNPLSCGLSAQCAVNFQPVDIADTVSGNVCCPRPQSDEL